MARIPVHGSCHICGVYTKLSFEHVPPRSAFNNRPILFQAGEDMLRAADPDDVKQIAQRGAGAHTLCPKCNNDTGRWYGGGFAEFAHQAMAVLHHTRGRATLYCSFDLFPLRVFKQVICMFFSINGPSFARANPELVNFVLNREASGLNPKYGVYGYYNASARGRSSGVAASASLSSGTSTIRVMSEAAFPPLGFLLAFSSEPPDDRLVDLSFMAKYHYNDRKDLVFRLPVLPVYTGFPGDYRDRDTVRRQAGETMAAMRTNGRDGA